MRFNPGMLGERAASRGPWAAVVLAALGYFVDIYDLILFSIVRVPSLKGIGLTGEALLSQGVLLLNMQMTGMLVGGILWGVLGDKRGRLSVLFGSILLYSVANIANGFVHAIGPYALWRFVAGLGLAGELGAGITLVSELMPARTRGYGTMLVTGVGVFGGVVAGLVGDFLSWRTAYFVGGGLGLLLLVMRLGVLESGLFEKACEARVSRGELSLLVKTPERALRYVCSILVGLPIWFVIGILVTYAPEFGKALGMARLPDPAKAVLLLYLGTTLGGFLSGALSEAARSRKRVALAFLAATGALIVLYLMGRDASLAYFYTLCLLLGLATGYWAVFITMASEQFGTNLRATVTTTAPNFVRGSLVPMSLCFAFAKARWGIVHSAALVGGAAVLLAAAALLSLGETYGRDLDFIEA